MNSTKEKQLINVSNTASTKIENLAHAFLIYMYKKQACLFKWGYMINYNENEAENEKQT